MSVDFVFYIGFFSFLILKLFIVVYIFEFTIRKINFSLYKAIISLPYLLNVANEKRYISEEVFHICFIFSFFMEQSRLDLETPTRISKKSSMKVSHKYGDVYYVKRLAHLIYLSRTFATRKPYLVPTERERERERSKDII